MSETELREELKRKLVDLMSYIKSAQEVAEQLHEYDTENLLYIIGVELGSEYNKLFVKEDES